MQPWSPRLQCPASAGDATSATRPPDGKIGDSPEWRSDMAVNGCASVEFGGLNSPENLLPVIAEVQRIRAETR